MSKWKSSSYDPPFPDSQHSNKRATEAEVRRLFDALDKDHNGYIDRHELQETMKEVGLNLTEKDINTMMQVANVPIKDRIFYEGHNSRSEEEACIYSIGSVTGRRTWNAEWSVPRWDALNILIFISTLLCLQCFGQDKSS
ncbi:hypothetical protein HELRODRAFT_175049 [Helobdella robusta]|uniref:EF-hand domain-containing protein n=1 Tax=Helobdella robusta TaxID=6412 RepID=T1F8S3_HELRO|nr:hypothetical protein HELRODRAFT_175049 [Helobdella robusta]ESO01025.1 hypothetical protein HELRODRAFT_175049 [Helobdella robusta]